VEPYGRGEAVGFDYGQRHVVELQARRVVREALIQRFPHWAVRLGADHSLDIRGFGAIGETAMTAERAIEITERGLPSTYVPGRNLIFLTYAAALADRLAIKALVGGMCETDFSGYPDCRRRTIDAMERALELGMERDFPIKTPLMHCTKAQTWAIAKGLGGQELVALIRAERHTRHLGRRHLTPAPPGRGRARGAPTGRPGPSLQRRARGRKRPRHRRAGREWKCAQGGRR
jgi:7-cyano-7-deazaguanine synthase